MLDISKKLKLPLSYVTGTAAILGQKRTGKSYKGSVLAECLLDAEQQIVVMDPTSAWWGLRASSDGKRAGYPITIFGGSHGDLTIDPTTGAEIARAVVHERFSAIFDFEGLTEREELRFSAAFLETLYRSKVGKYRTPLHLFLDEADIYAPQNTKNPEAYKTLGACGSIVRRGGIKGIGCTMITQRPAVLNKDVLTQVDTLITLRFAHPSDMVPMNAWISVHGDPKVAKEMMVSLPDLKTGDAWIWSPSNGLFGRVSFRDRTTFDSGKTPEAGKNAAPPKVLAKVDIDKLGEAIAASVAKSKESDPKHLQAEVARLKKANAELVAGVEREVQRKLAAKPVAATSPKVVEKRVIDLKDLKQLDRVVERFNVQIDSLGETRTKMIETRDKIASVSALWAGNARLQTVEPKTNGHKVASEEQMAPIERLRRATKTAPAVPSKVGTAGLAPAHLRLLSAIAWWESIGVSVPDLGGVAFIAGTSTKSSAFDNNRSRLRAAGYIDYPTSGRVRLTDAGRELAPPPLLPPTNDALHNAILQKVTPAHGRMLRVLIEAYPNEMSLEDLAKRAGTSATSSAFDNNRSWLRARGLTEYPMAGVVRATALLFPEAAP